MVRPTLPAFWQAHARALVAWAGRSDGGRGAAWASTHHASAAGPQSIPERTATGLASLKAGTSPAPIFGLESGHGSTGAAAAAAVAVTVVAGGGATCFAACDSDGEPPSLHERQAAASSMGVSNEHTAQWRIYTDKGAGLIKEGNLTEAEAWLRRALKEAIAGFGDSTPHVAAASNNLAECLRLQGQFSEAEPLYLKGLETLEKALGTSDPRLGQAYHNLVAFYAQLKKLDQALSFARKSHQVFLNALGQNHPQVARSMFTVAELLRKQGWDNDALALMLEAVQLMENNGDLHTRAGIQRLQRTVALLVSKGKLEKADITVARVLQLLAKEMEPGADEIGFLSLLRGEILKRRQRWAEAHQHFKDALDIYAKKMGRQHRMSLYAAISSANALELSGEADASERVSRDLPGLLELSKSAWHTATDPPSGFQLGSWSFSWGKPKPSEATKEEQLRAALQYAQTLRVAAKVWARSGSEKEAADCLVEAYLVISSTAKLTAETRRAARRALLSGVEPVAEILRPPSSGESDEEWMESALAHELLLLQIAVRSLLGQANASTASEPDHISKLEEVLRMES